MAKGKNQKLKLLYLAQIFNQYTDESHGLTLAEITQKLKGFEVNADRKTLYMDFEELRHFGMDIISDVWNGHHVYYLASRDFELAELKLLVDSVQSSKFITEKKSRSLIRKLEGLVSVHDAKQLQRQVLIAGRIKTMNESIYYNVDKLHSAINADKQIRFRYFQWDVNKQEVFRHGGATYQISPWHLRWDDENYYLIGYDAESHRLKHYRVDKMRYLSITDIPRDGRDVMRDFDEAKYTTGLFGMYGGESMRVTLEGSNSFVGILIDRFGKDIMISPVDDGHFCSFVDVAVSPQFLGWIASLGGSIRITAPQSVVDQMRELTAKLAEQYSG